MPTRLVLAVLIALASACSPSRASEVPLPPKDLTRLSHAQHAQLPCSGCHRSSARPGQDDHKPCDDGACHRKEFLAQPGPLCQVCHTQIVAQPLSAPLKPYPIEDAWQALPSRFSHKRHLDKALMESRVGFNITCSDCHERDRQRVRPDHATCGRCHSAEAGLPNAPRMDQCTSCHLDEARERTRARVIRDDLHFDHERHRVDRRGRAIRCDACHKQTTQSPSYADHTPPTVSTCVTCHDDSDRVPKGMSMRVCETCHSARTGSLTTIAPRSHLPSTERPLDHTLAFRRDHAEVANRDAKRCATCHTRMSGNPRQACDECHQTMQPADHRIMWRELDHGPEAAADRERCARCHVVEFCTSCHAQRPRSHGMVGTFMAEHGRLARINIRACTTCHGDSFCAQCHSAPAPRFAP
ncbi:MAG TPA: hypothetical protein VM513_10650 [Kofleriaceae bacterium]|jgi:hypothetical protein|nr:hypothetical protein [Kofleriaceae bacterium]